MILVTGSNGLVGSYFIKNSKLKTELQTPKSVNFNITDKSQVQALINSYDLKAIINLAAKTDFLAGEKERDDKNGDFWKTNVEGVKNIVEVLASQEKKNIHYIQFSTSRVFSDKGPFSENQKPETNSNKTTWYGYTKSIAESIVRDFLGDKATIIRLANVVGNPTDNGDNEYIQKLLSLINRDIPIVKDQQISISYLKDISNVLDNVIENQKYGTFHISSRDITTPLELVSYYLTKTGKGNEKIRATDLQKLNKSQNFPDYFYPKLGGLKVEQTEKALSVKFKDWKSIVDSVIQKSEFN
jgi:dTDP-4-dehydrorhamnose reductase